jgi:tryptophanyl-tRNA synthetase
MRGAFADGIAWGDAKQRLFERIDAELAPARTRYEALIARPQEIEERLLAGAQKARKRSREAIDRLRWAVGVRRLTETSGATSDERSGAHASHSEMPLPQIKRYREADGKFYFKLAGDDGTTLLQSRAFDSPRDVGRIIDALVDAGGDAGVTALLLKDALPADASADISVVSVALARLKADKIAREEAKR